MTFMIRKLSGKIEALVILPADCGNSDASRNNGKMPKRFYTLVRINTKRK